MKKITFNVTLTFSDKISDDRDIQEITKNITSALLREANELGLTPDGSDGYITHIETAEGYSGAKSEVTV